MGNSLYDMPPMFILDFDEVILIGIAGIPAAFVTISDDKTEINE
jgi:hypothetical protein